MDTTIQAQLLQAISTANLSKVIGLLQAGADPNFYYHTYQGCEGSPLHLTNSAEIAEQLLLFGAFVDSRDWYGSTPLLRAIERGCIDIVKVLLNYNASVTVMDGLGERVLPCAIRYFKGNMDIINTLIKYGVSVNGCIWNPHPPVHVAVLCNHLAVIDELFKQGAYIDQKNERGLTALQVAIQQPSVDTIIIKKLLELGADCNAECPNNESTLDLAVTHRDIDIVRELLKKGAFVVHKDRHRKSVLYKAVIKDTSVNLDVIQELLNYGAQAGRYAHDQMNENAFVIEENSPVRFAVKRYMNSKSVPEWVMLLLKYSTIEHLEIYEYYSTYELIFILGNLSNYAVKCISEVSRMRRDFIDEHRSLYDFIKLYIKNDICLHSLDYNIVNKLFHILLRNDYNIYADIIGGLISREFLLQKLYTQNIFTISSELKRVPLVPDTSYHIASFLSNTDLLNLLLAYGLKK